nr:PREDICTED: nuclear fragile X mental retardation-interacting protein 1 [Bemisia tabaci]
MVRLRGRSSRARGSRRGGVSRGGIGQISRGGGRGGRGGSFPAPGMVRPRPPAVPPGFLEPDFGYGPRIPPMIPPPVPGPRGLRPYPPVHPAVPFPRARPFPGDYPVRHPMGMPPVPPRPMLPPVPPFVRGRGAFRGSLPKTGKAFNNGTVSQARAAKKKLAKAKKNEENDPFYCEACNRSWKTAEALQEHISEHEVCGREGCTFTAHPKIVALHVQFHHFTGIYKKIANVQSPEDIEKWIAERKSRYPTDANVAMRKAKKEEMIERGERVEESKTDRHNRPKRGEQRSHKPNWRDKRFGRSGEASSENKPTPKKNQVTFDEDDNDPKKDWNGNLPPFQGLPCLSTIDVVESKIETPENLNQLESTSSHTDPDASISEDIVHSSPVSSSNCGVDELKNNPKDESFSESEEVANVEHVFNSETDSTPTISNDSKNVTSDVKEEIKVAPKRSSNDSDSSSDVKMKLVPYDVGTNETDDSEPEECSIVKTTENHPAVSSDLVVSDPVETKNSSEVDTGVINSKSRKRHRHRNSGDKQKDTTEDSVKKDNCFKKKKLTLLEKLLSKEIRHERNVILQCVHFVVSNDFFDFDKRPSRWADDSDSDCSCDY